MSESSLPPRTNRRTSRHLARFVVPVGAVALAFGGFAIAQAATDSGVDTPHDLAERGLDAANPPVDDDAPPSGTAPNPASAAPTETATFDTVNLPDGATQTFAAGAAGTVTIGRSGSALSVVAVGTNPGWTAHVEQETGPEVEVEFDNGTVRIDLEAELEDGAVRVRVRERTVAEPDDATTPTTRVDNSGPGSANSGRDESDDGPDQEVGDDSGSHSGSSGSGSSGSSGSGSSGSGHSGSDD